MFEKRESDEFDLTAELAALERRLAGMTPVAPRVDRDRLMFAAGMARSEERGGKSEKRGAKSGNWFWPAATALASAASVVLATALWWQSPSPRGGVAVQPAAKPPSVEPDDVIADAMIDRLDKTPWPDLANSGYLGMRNVALTRGVGALFREPHFAGSQDQRSIDAAPYEPATSRDLLKELLPEAANGTRSQS